MAFAKAANLSEILFGSDLFPLLICYCVCMSGRFFPVALIHVKFWALREFYSLVDTKCILRVMLPIVSSSLHRLSCTNKVTDGDITTRAFCYRVLASLFQTFAKYCCNVLPLASGS